MVMEKWNDSPYYGTVTNTHKDKDGEVLYYVRYADNDYEEYSFLEVIQYLQPYNPFQNEDDTVEITPVFGSNGSDLKVTDDEPNQPVTWTPKPVKTVRSEHTQTRNTPTRKSARVRVVRNIHNLSDDPRNDAHIPSSINSSRSRKKYHNTKVKAFRSLLEGKKRYAVTM